MENSTGRRNPSKPPAARASLRSGASASRSRSSPPRPLTLGIERVGVLPSGPGASHTPGWGTARSEKRRGGRRRERGGGRPGLVAAGTVAAVGSSTRPAPARPRGETRERARRQTAPRAQAAPSLPSRGPVVRPARR